MCVRETHGDHGESHQSEQQKNARPVPWPKKLLGFVYVTFAVAERKRFMWRQYTTSLGRDGAATGLPLARPATRSEELVETARAAGITPPSPPNASAAAHRATMRQWKDRLMDEARTLDFYNALRSALADYKDAIISEGASDPTSTVTSPPPTATTITAGSSPSPRKPRRIATTAASPSPVRRRLTTSAELDSVASVGTLLSSTPTAACSTTKPGVRRVDTLATYAMCPVCGETATTLRYLLDHLDRCTLERRRFEAMFVRDVSAAPAAAELPFPSIDAQAAPLAAIRRVLTTACWTDARGDPARRIESAMCGLPAMWAPELVHKQLALPCPMGCFCVEPSCLISSHCAVAEHSTRCWEVTFVRDAHVRSTLIAPTTTYRAKVSSPNQTLGELLAAAAGELDARRCAVVRQLDDVVVPLNSRVMDAWALWFVVFEL
jgi:hypothetical protein